MNPVQATALRESLAKSFYCRIEEREDGTLTINTLAGLVDCAMVAAHTAYSDGVEYGKAMAEARAVEQRQLGTG